MTSRRPLPPTDLEDLSIRARREDLPADERARLDRALEASLTLSVAHQVGRDFDDVRRVHAGDDELILRASAGALARPRTSTPGRRRLAALLSAAALFVASAAAATSAWLVTHPEPEAPAAAPTTPDEPSNPTSRTPRRRVSHPGSPSAADEAPPIEQTPLEALPVEPTLSAREPAPSAHAAAAEKPSAASLLRDANAARRAGDFASAEASYHALQSTFPGTSEARVSRVSLGKLLLNAGKPRDADREFRLYLSTGGGALTEEALVGRAEALARLGDRGEERRLWQELLQQHPSSVYAARARTRLAELEPAGGSRK